MDKNELNDWDKIYAKRDQLIKEKPERREFKRFKVYKDEESTIRCAKCGSTEDISGCPECQEEKKYLKEKNI